MAAPPIVYLMPDVWAGSTRDYQCMNRDMTALIQTAAEHGWATTLRTLLLLLAFRPWVYLLIPLVVADLPHDVFGPG